MQVLKTRSVAFAVALLAIVLAITSAAYRELAG